MSKNLIVQLWGKKKEKRRTDLLLFERVRFDSKSGCWNWMKSLDRRGYAKFWITDLEGNRRCAQVHRVAYEIFRGKIPEGLVIDHLCRNPRCINPWHMEAVTTSTNLRRGETVVAKCLAKVECPRGHPLSGDNLYAYVTKKGIRHRQCLRCRRTYQERRKRATYA
jgi:hypothetical protein